MDSHKAKLAAVLGTAALAIPGGMLVSTAFAAGDDSSGGTTTDVPVQQTQDPYAPSQEERPDGRDCPNEDGGNAGSGSQETAL